MCSQSDKVENRDKHLIGENTLNMLVHVCM